MIDKKRRNILLMICLLAAGCGPSADPESPVLMICIDGVEASVMKPMLDRGDLPNIAALIDKGICGSIETVAPAQSPVIWTTVATGKTKQKHGITGFTDPNTDGPFTSNARCGKALWNITTDFNLSCNVVGYWITWPAEDINGVIVSQATSPDQVQAQKLKKGTLFKDLENATSPPEFINEIWPSVEKARQRENLNKEVITPVFGDLKKMDVPARIMELINSSYWSFESDLVYHAAAVRLFRENPADINIVYYGGTDVIGHRFWCYREPELYSYPILDRYIEAFGKSIERYYALIDRMIGEQISLFPENTRIIVLSDHGMHADFLDGTVNGQMPTLLSGHHLDGPPGVFIAAGPGIRKEGGVEALLKREAFPDIGSVFDVAPTILYLLDIPVGRDMKPGKVMRGILTSEQLSTRKVEYEESHDKGFRPPTPSRSSREADKEFIERFQELGYL